MTIPTNNKKKANYPLFTMNKRRTILLTVCAMLLAASCQQKGTMDVKTDPDAQLKSENDSISWAMGNILGQNVLASGIEIDRQLLVQSLLATLDDNNKLLNEEQIVAMQQRIEEKFYASQNERYKSTMEDVRKQVNSELAAYEQISIVKLYPHEFEKTPKKSIKRFLYTNMV